MLAQNILQGNVAPRERIEKIKEDEHFQWLMKVLANLKNQSPALVLAGLQAADITMDSNSEDKTKSILKCGAYSHSNLSPDPQRLLLCLAPFSGFIFLGGIPHYTQELQKLAPFQDYPFDKLDSAIGEAINWGLLSPDQDIPQLLTIQPVFPYFLQAKLNESTLSLQEALGEGFKNYYIPCAGAYQQLMESKEPQKRQNGIFISLQCSGAVLKEARDSGYIFLLGSILEVN